MDSLLPLSASLHAH